MTKQIEKADNKQKPNTIKAPQDKFKDEYVDMLIKHMSQGMSFMSFGGVVGAGRTTLYDWCDRYPKFKEAKQIGELKSQQWMEQRLMLKISGQEIRGIDTKKIDTTALIFALKTRFHKTYGEKQELTSTGEIKITIDSDDDNL